MADRRADLWDRAHRDLVEPAMLTIGADGRGEIIFGAMQGGLELEYARSTVFFTWAGFEEMDEVSGSGSAELQDDGSLEQIGETDAGMGGRLADAELPAFWRAIEAGGPWFETYLEISKNVGEGGRI